MLIAASPREHKQRERPPSGQCADRQQPRRVEVRREGGRPRSHVEAVAELGGGRSCSVRPRGACSLPEARPLLSGWAVPLLASTLASLWGTVSVATTARTPRSPRTHVAHGPVSVSAV